MHAGLRTCDRRRGYGQYDRYNRLLTNFDSQGDLIVLRHRRPVSQPYPNAYSHPLPQFSYSQETREIAVSFSCDPAYPSPGSAASSAWRRRRYILSSVPMKRPKSFIDDASAFLSATVAAPFSLLAGSISPQSKSTPEEVFGGNIDLAEDEMLEQDRGEEGEVDDSPEPHRNLRLLSIDPGSTPPERTNARKRRQWQVSALRKSVAHHRIQ